MISPFEAAEQTRKRITADHAVLRSICRVLVAAVEAATLDERRRPFVVDMLTQLCVEVRLHLEYEEDVLVPILRGADAWGPVRVEELAREHADQRAVITALLEEAEGIQEMRELTGEIAEFTRRLERDIEEEERDLLTAEALGDRIVVIDQIDG